MGELYVVRGAKVKCSLGSKTTKLNLPESHGLYVNEKPVLIDTDIVASVNVMPFGECKKKDGRCNPALADCWKDTKEDAFIKGRSALITRSVLSCSIGGQISIQTDGQN